MFDIGFWELVVIAVVTLLVVGPDEFPTVVRKVSSWINDVRRYIAAVKADFDHEIRKAEELKKLIAKEAEIAEMHKVIDETQTAIPVNYDQLRKKQGGEMKKEDPQTAPADTAPLDDKTREDRP